MVEENKKDVLRDIEDICRKYEIKKSDISCILDEISQNIQERKLHENIDANKKLVGNAYRQRVKPYYELLPEMFRYYKVISERADYEGRVSCLAFDEKPYYFFEYQNDHPDHFRYECGVWFLGRFEFTPIWIEEIEIFHKDGLSSFEKIEASVFDTELESMWKKILNMEWFPDHSRNGKLPGEEGWKRSEEEMRGLWRFCN